METSTGSITEQHEGYSVEKMLFTYDENEMEENRIAKETADIVLRPEFIPIYPKMLQNGYSMVETAVYGFMRFFLSNNERFYCTNEQIAQMLNVSEKTISLAISKLKDQGIISIAYKMRAGGGKIRFIKLQNVIYDITNCNVATLQNHTNIYNKEIENKVITNTGQNKFQEFWSRYPKKVQKKDTERKFNALSQTKQQLAIDALDKFMQTDQRKRGYVPNPTTYINQERRNDELVVEQQTQRISPIMRH